MCPYCSELIHKEITMRKTLHGIRFDTDTAVEIGTAGSLGILMHWEATLYRTPRSKRYFLAGYGGPMTRFAQSAGCDAWTDAQDLIPLTYAQAKQWALQYLARENIEQHFNRKDDQQCIH